MNDSVNRFVAELREAQGDNLVSAVLYGSAVKSASPDGLPAKNINILIVLNDVALSRLSSSEAAIRRARAAKIEPLFWSERELRNSWDVFPVELDGISRQRSVLYGPDPFSEFAIDRNHLRYQIEFEFRSKLFKLRSEWLEVRKSRAALADFVGRAGASFLHLFPYARQISDGKIEESAGMIFERCARFKDGKAKASQPELEQLYQEMHDGAGRIVSVINNA